MSKFFFPVFKSAKKQESVAESDQAGSVAITDESQIRRFTDNPDFPFLVSFPRTGSHWLRMLMELYFEKPSLVRAFFHRKPTDFSCYHWHDEDLALERRNVLYLYRHPVPTIFSQLNYYKEDINNAARIEHWAALYGQHLRKWLLVETFTARKTVVTYEGLKSDLSASFKQICDHFDVPFHEEKLVQACALVTKENLKEKTQHDQQVVNLTQSYAEQRQAFESRHRRLVLETVLAQDARLNRFFPSLAAAS